MKKTISSGSGESTLEICPICGAPLGEVVTTTSGRQVQRCSKGVWNQHTKQVEGCTYVKWLPIEPVRLDEVCPKCGAQLILKITRYGKRFKKCSQGGWDKETKQPVGCDYTEWFHGSTEKLDEKCPLCGQPLVLVTTETNKRLKKCSTAGWDKTAKQATGCTYVQWL